MLGLGGQYLVTQHDGYGINLETNKENDLKMGYGGLVVEYTFFETKAVHFTANSLGGFGLVTTVLMANMMLRPARTGNLPQNLGSLRFTPPLMLK